MVLNGEREIRCRFHSGLSGTALKGFFTLFENESTSKCQCFICRHLQSLFLRADFPIERQPLHLFPLEESATDCDSTVSCRISLLHSTTLWLIIKG
ncbi:hypothetical protein AVEN_231846-1 [Araneus ventricosus]|uniref:Uncharacterized protein n=1 Tax=Araneus ventricosus TaxID=182803 RepID=A0A4Y2VCG7_ARAVE|nr:hypothetical protein AVEN_231846-1 [Araneus ventricosus]